MHRAFSTRGFLRGGLALPVAAVIALAGCTMVGDTITGLSITAANPSDCIKACGDIQTQSVHAEAALHLAQIRACQAKHNSEKHECIAAEARRHQAAMDEIAASRAACLDGCHRQGSSTTG